VKILAGNKCECPAAQRAVDKDRGEKVIVVNVTENIDQILIESAIAVESFFDSAAQDHLNER
jgi:hypothetical protein